MPELGFEHLGYGSTRAGFQQESTVGQFFDEEQFEAHRRLGHVLPDQMIREVRLKDRLERSTKISAALAAFGRARLNLSPEPPSRWEPPQVGLVLAGMDG